MNIFKIHVFSEEKGESGRARIVESKIKSLSMTAKRYDKSTLMTILSTKIIFKAKRKTYMQHVAFK